MTAGAGRICRAECAADVTAFAGDVGVSTVENETRTEMIESLLSNGVAAGKEHHCKDGREYHVPKQSRCESSRVSRLN